MRTKDNNIIILQYYNNNIVKSIMKWKSLGKRPWRRPKKRWIDIVEENLRNMIINIWK